MVIRQLVACLLGLVVLIATRDTDAQTWDGDLNQDWNTAQNWSGNVLPGGTNLIINTATGNFPIISANPTFTPIDINVGLLAGVTSGRLDHTAGILNTGNGNWMRVGVDADSTGVYNLGIAGGSGVFSGLNQGTGSVNVGGTSTTSGRLTIGNSNSTGTVNMNTTGTMTLENDNIALLMGDGGTSTGNFNLDGGVLNVNSLTGNLAMLVGTNGGDGNFRMSGGDVNVTGRVWLGDNNSNSDGLLQISGGTFDANGVEVGRTNGHGTINMTGGTLTTPQLFIARGTGAGNTGTGSVSVGAGATLNVSNELAVGYAGNGPGGALGTMDVAGIVKLTGGVFNIGVFDNVRGTLNINAGADIQMHNNTIMRFGVVAGSTTVGIVNHNGGNVTFYSDGGVTVGGTGFLNMQEAGTGSHTYNLNGGTLTVSRIDSNANGGARVFNFNGGTLKATQNEANFIAFNTNGGAGSNRVNIRNGGAFIDTNGFDVGISRPLDHSNIGGDNATDGGLTKSGGGTLSLTGANTFNGNLVVNAGVVAAGLGLGNPAGNANQSSAVGDIGTAVSRRLIVNNGGTLSLTAGNTLGTGGSTNTLSGVTLEVNAGGIFRTGKDGAGAGWWNKIGAVELNGGTLSVGSGANNGAFQGLALIGTVTVGGTGASTINNLPSSDAAFNAIHLGQNNTAGQMITFNVADVTGDANADLTVAAKMINTSNTLTASGLTKSGAGTMVLSGANTYTGLTWANGGTLSLTGSSTGGGVMLVGNAAGTANLSLSPNATSTFSELIIGNNDSFGPSVAGTATSGTAAMTSGSVTASNWLLVGRQAGVGVFEQQGGTVTNPNTATGFVALGWHFSTAGGASGTYNLSNNAVLNANSALNIGGIGATSLSIGDGNGDTGLMTLSNTSQVVAANRVLVGVNSGSNGTLTLNDNSSFTLTGGGTAGLMVWSGTGNINVNGGTLSSNWLTLGQNTGSNGTLTQTGGTVSLTTLWTTFSGTGTYHLNGGTLSVDGFNKGSGSGTINFNGGTLKATAGWTLGGGNVTTAQIRNGGLTVDTNGQNPTISQALVHSTIGGDNAIDGGLTKVGAGTLTLSGNNTYTGATNVNVGTLALSHGSNNNIAQSNTINVASGANLDVTGLAGAADLILASGQTLKGAGVVTGSVTAAAGSTIAPGTSIESLGITGAIGFNQGTFAYEMNTNSKTADLLFGSTGTTLDLDNNPILNLIDLGSSAQIPGTKFTLISYDGLWDGGTFAGFADDSFFFFAGNDWFINYNDLTPGSNFLGDTSNSSLFVTISAVPEPGSLSLVALVALALAVYAWHHRRGRRVG